MVVLVVETVTKLNYLGSRHQTVTGLPPATRMSLVWHPECPPRTVDQYRRVAHSLPSDESGPAGPMLWRSPALRLRKARPSAL